MEGLMRNLLHKSFRKENIGTHIQADSILKWRKIKVAFICLFKFLAGFALPWLCRHRKTKKRPASDKELLFDETVINWLVY